MSEWFAVKVRGKSLHRPPRKYIFGRYFLPEGCRMLHFFPVDVSLRFSTVGWFNFSSGLFSLLSPCKSLHPCGAKKNVHSVQWSSSERDKLRVQWISVAI